MPRNDDIEEGAAQGAPRRLGTVPSAALLTPPAAPADLRAALATIPAEWGRRMFDPASLDTRMAACKLTVKHPEDLLVLRQALFDDLCPSITWILRTSVLEWEYLSAEQKQQQTEMREAWLSGYNKPSEAILQHWLWKFLKDRTRQFAHLHKVFTNIPSNTPQCGTAAWTQIFFHYPLSVAVLAHKLLARGLKACLKFKDDSSAAGCAYIESVNTSVSQLSNLPHLSVPDVFALVSLMGLYLSDAHGHQKAYKDLITFIDEGNELTLDKVQNTVIYHSRDTSLRAFALTHAGASPSCNHRCPRCCDTRGTTRLDPLAHQAVPVASLVALLPPHTLCEASWSAWLTKNSQAQILYTPSMIKTLLLNARTFGVLTACPRRLRPSPTCSTATTWPPSKSSSMQVARIMRMTAPTSPLPTLLSNSSVKAMNLLTTTATLDPRP
jgi:hypothetical protein